MKKLSSAASVVAMFLLASGLPARAGYRIQEVDPEFPGEVTSYWFQGGKVRVDGALEGLTMIMDTKAGEGWLIDAALKRYSGGKFDALAAELAKFNAEEGGEEDADEGGAEAGTPAKPHSVEVKDLGPADRLLGYETKRHQVMVDGELIEELWIAPKINIAAEVDPAAFATAMRRMLGDGMSVGQGYEESAAYRALRATGYPLRQILYFVGEKSTLEVSAVTAQTFPADDFLVPKGYTRVGYAELLLGEGE